MFSTKKKEENYGEWHARNRAKALLDEPRVRAEQPAKLSEFQAQHLKDAESYSFRCERFGDFLALFIERRGAKVIASVNIEKSAIKFVEGHPPNMEGWLNAYVQGDGSFEWRRQYCFSEYGGQNLGDRAGMFVTDPKPEPGRGMTIHGGPESVYGIDKCAQGAADDAIRFEAAGATLYAPAGLGRSVYDAILAACRKSAE